MEQNVQPAEPLVDRQAQLVQTVVLGDVHRDQGGGLAGGGLDLIIEGLKAALGAGHGDNVGASLGEGEGGGVADPPAGAGDEGDAVFERQVGHEAGSLAADRAGVRPLGIALRDGGAGHQLNLVEDHQRDHRHSGHSRAQQGRRHRCAAG